MNTRCQHYSFTQEIIDEELVPEELRVETVETDGIPCFVIVMPEPVWAPGKRWRW